MKQETSHPIELFYSYAHRDERIRRRLLNNLKKTDELVSCKGNRVASLI